MRVSFLKGSLNPLNILNVFRFRRKNFIENPNVFGRSGIMIFCGSQGSGKTLSAVSYIKKLLIAYPACILVTNTDISGLPENTQVIEYGGLSDLTDIENGENGVVYFIDEIHLELNSLESKNIGMDVIVELSQQRKQRKHIVGTSQVYMRMAKPLREQVKDVILCSNFLGFVQYNTHINGFESYEENGKLKAAVIGRYIWFHSPLLYGSYDTYAKMKRYRDDWNSRKDVYRS